MTNHDKQLFGRELQGRKTFDGFMFIFFIYHVYNIFNS